MHFRKSFYTIFLISLSILILSRCIQTADGEIDPRGKQYAGSKACVQCHKNVYDSYVQTAHHQTSHPATDSALQTAYDLDSDSFSFPSEKMVIEKKNHHFYQSLYTNGQLTNSQPFDIVFGSGEKAETFAYWKGDQLYQLPLSFFSQIPGWANSPGFPAHKAYFDKVIVRRCFECHASWVKKETQQNGSLSVKEMLQPASIVYGIDCERCHGPAAMHVSYHLENPSEKTARQLIKWDGLSRQQKLDGCAVCHSGNDLATQKTTFAFQPGDTLTDFYYPAFGSAGGTPDVHGKQMQLLAASACFQNSNELSCTSCHNTHHNERADNVLFSQRCITCHQPEGNHFCKLAKTIGPTITQNCIDCHMPKQASKAISFQKTGQEQTTAYYLRTHRIAIYPDETAKIIKQLNKGNKQMATPIKDVKTP